MHAMVFEGAQKALQLKTLPLPVPSAQQVLIKVIACGVCRTDLHIIDGELTKPKLPLIPGHEIVGMVAQTGNNVSGLKEGDLVFFNTRGGVSHVGIYLQNNHPNTLDRENIFCLRSPTSLGSLNCRIPRCEILLVFLE